MTEPTGQPQQGSTKEYCSVLADGTHYYAHHVGQGVYFRQCLSCNYVDASEMAAELAAQKRVLDAMNKIAEAFRACLPTVQQLAAMMGPFITAMTAGLEEASRPLASTRIRASDVPCSECAEPMFTNDDNNYVCAKCGRTAFSA
jgi:ribosomal protein S27AE